MDKTPLARVLRDQGRQIGWVARGLGVHRNAVSRWVNGKEATPPARVPQLAALLGVDESEIVEEEKVA